MSRTDQYIHLAGMLSKNTLKTHLQKVRELGLEVRQLQVYHIEHHRYEVEMSLANMDLVILVGDPQDVSFWRARELLILLEPFLFITLAVHGELMPKMDLDPNEAMVLFPGMPEPAELYQVIHDSYLGVAMPSYFAVDINDCKMVLGGKVLKPLMLRSPSDPDEVEYRILETHAANLRTSSSIVCLLEGREASWEDFKMRLSHLSRAVSEDGQGLVVSCCDRVQGLDSPFRMTCLCEDGGIGGRSEFMCSTDSKADHSLSGSRAGTVALNTTGIVQLTENHLAPCPFLSSNITKHANFTRL